MDRRSFLKGLFAGTAAAVIAETIPARSYFFAPIGGWQSDLIFHPPKLMFNPPAEWFKPALGRVDRVPLLKGRQIGMTTFWTMSDLYRTFPGVPWWMAEKVN